MNRLYLKTFLLLAFVFFLSVEDLKSQDFTLVKDVEIVQLKINKVASSIETIKSSFVQEKHLSFQ